MKKAVSWHVHYFLVTIPECIVSHLSRRELELCDTTASVEKNNADSFIHLLLTVIFNYFYSGSHIERVILTPQLNVS